MTLPSPKQAPIYDIYKTYQENVEQGPFLPELIPQREDSFQSMNFLGFEVRSPIGVAAGPLLNSKWILLASQLGFDIVTYKTIRSQGHPGHPLPNMIFVKREQESLARKLKTLPTEISDITMTNSFGMPSRSPEFLMQDIEKANQSLSKGQVMIVSVVGSLHKDKSFQQDFVDAALLAKDAGAKIIEANFSCPNVEKSGGSLYKDPDTVFTFASAIKKAISPLPLVLKIGKFDHLDQMKKVFIAAAKAKVDAICGLNSVSMKVIDDQGLAPLGKTRPTSGVCGSAIRDDALEFIASSVRINQTEKLGLTLMGVGGIMISDHFDQFLNQGADIAMSATAMMWDPYLALRYHQKKEIFV